MAMFGIHRVAGTRRGLLALAAAFLAAGSGGCVNHRRGSTSSPSPAGPFPVGVRHLDLRRAPNRPLPTTIWYPALRGSRATASAGAAPAAEGRFPMALFSHGLPSVPETYAGFATRLAAAGFVVAAPVYPHTNSNAVSPTMLDVPNQPADAFFVADQVLRLDQRAGDPFAGHLDTSRYAAVGHSAGGFTTTGMLAATHDHRLAAVVVIAGGMLGRYTPPACDALFVHGDADTTMSYAAGRTAYELLPWSKAFLTLRGGDHGGYLEPGNPGFEPVASTVTDFLRASLTGDAAARGRLPADASAGGIHFEDRLG